MRILFLLPILPFFVIAQPANMILIQGGTFLMGNNDLQASRDQKPVHSVTVNSFYLGKYEVSISDFKKFVDDTNYKTDAETEGWSYVWAGRNWEKMLDVNWRYDALGKPMPLDKYNHPVMHVSWNDAMEYCRWMSRSSGLVYRLPTESEWEYAAGGGRGLKTKWSGTSNKDSLFAYANYQDSRASKDKFEYTAPVGTYLPNSLGLYDMSGNMWEWCSDWYDGSYPTGAQQNPKGVSTGAHRVLRGGSWKSEAMYGSNTQRYFNTPSYRNSNFGFRVAAFVK